METIHNVPKWMTERHYAPIAVGLLEMNGDLNKFNESMTTGYKVIDGYNLQMQSMSNQIELAKNNFMALNATAFDSIKGGFLPLIKLFNETSGSLREMNSILPVLSSALAGLFTYFTVLSTSAVINNIKTFMSVFARANPYIKGIAIAIGLFVAASSLINKIQAPKLEKIADINKKFENINKNKQEIEGLTNEIKMLNKEYADLAKVSTSNALDRQRDVWDRYSKAVGLSAENISNILKDLRAISEIDPTKSIDEMGLLEQKKSRLESAKQQAVEMLNKNKNSPIEVKSYSMLDENYPYYDQMYLTPSEIDYLKKNFNTQTNKLNTRNLDILMPELLKKLTKASGVGNVGTEYFGQKRLKYAIESGLTSPEYKNYVINQEAISKYDLAITKTNKEILELSSKTLIKQREALQNLGNEAKDILVDYGVDDIKNSKTFTEWSKNFTKYSGEEVPSILTNKIKPNETNIEFLKSQEALGYIDNIINANHAIKETKNTIKFDEDKLKDKNIKEEEKNAIKGNIAEAKNTIIEWEKVIGRAKLALVDLSKGVSKGIKDSLVNVNFKEIKSNVEQLTSEIKYMGLTGVEAIDAQLTQLTTSTDLAKKNLQDTLDKLKYDGVEDYQAVITAYETNPKYQGKEGEKLVPKDEQLAYERAIKIKQTMIDINENDLSYKIKSFKLNGDKISLETKSKRNLEDEVMAQWKMGKYLTQSIELKDIAIEKQRIEEDLKTNSISKEEHDLSIQKLKTKEMEVHNKYKQQELETQERIRESIEKVQEMKKEIQDLKSIDWTGTVFEPLTKIKGFKSSLDSINNKNTEQQTNLKHTYLTTNMTYLEFEQKQKEINIATELEKTKLAKEQLEYARSMADTLYNAFKSGNIAEGIFGQLGNIGGIIGGGKLGESLFGGIGKALGISGGAVGGFVGQLGGSIVGGFLQDTFFGSDEAHRKNEEYANYLLEQIKELQKANNAILNSAFGQVSTVGTTTALNQVMSKATLAEVEGRHTVHKSGILGIGAKDKTYTKKLEEERITSYNDLLAKQADYQNKLNSLGKTYYDKYGNASFKYYSNQEKADKQAYEQRLKQINDLIAKTEEYKKYAKDAYAGFEVTFDDVTNKVTENWDKTYSQILTDIKNFKSIGSNIGSLMFTGIKDYLIGENSVYNTLLISISSEFKSFFATDMKNGISTVLIDDINSLKIEQINYNNKLNEMVKIWQEAGQSISDIISSTSELTQSVYNGIISAFDSSEFSARFNSISETVSKGFMDKFKKQLLDKSMANTFFEFNQIATDIMNKDTVSLSDAISLRTEMEKVSASMQNESSKTQAIVDLLNMKDVEYTSSSQAIQYSSGSTNTNVYNLNSNITVDVGNMVTMDKGDKQYFANEIGVEVLNVIEAKIGKINK